MQQPEALPAAPPTGGSATTQTTTRQYEQLSSIGSAPFMMSAADMERATGRRLEDVPTQVKTGSVETIGIVKQPIETTIFLRPLAFPSCLGLACFFASTWLVSTYYCDWWGGVTTPGQFFWFVLMTGGVGQFISGLYGFPARDNMACVIHVFWGSFFIYYGLTELLKATGSLPATTDKYETNVGLALVFSPLMAITWVCCIAAFTREAALVVTLFLLAMGSTLAIPGFDNGNSATIKAAAYFFMLASLAALYRVMVYLVLEGWGQIPRWLPVVKMPWEKLRGHVAIPINEPGIKKGQ